MSNAYAIGTVSVVLKRLLDNAVAGASVGSAKTTVLAPDQVKVATSDLTRLNLFLYHVEPNAGWRNAALPSRDGNGQRISNPPLALDLYYLLTAYGKDEFEAEILLGWGAQFLHEVPVLTRDAIRAAFTPPIVDPTMAKLATSELAEQIEQIRVTLAPMNSDDMSKLWSALQSNYRPSIAYHVSVVLIEAARPARSPLPVLTRAPLAVPHLFPPFPTLTDAKPPNDQIAVHLGDVLTLAGHDLGGDTVAVNFEHARLAAPLTVTPPDAVTPAEIAVTIPSLPAAWPAGSYSVSATIAKGAKVQTTNSLPLVLAPRMGLEAGTEIDATVTRSAGKLTVTIKSIAPQVLPQQKASLVLGDVEALAEPRTTKVSKLTFVFDKTTAPPKGDYFTRLRVDGVESVLIRRDLKPPQFDPTQVLKVTV